MAISLKPLDQQIVVITGASSGIGLATAFAAADQGAKLVLAARSEQPLEEIAQEIAQSGGEAYAVAADVADRVQVERIARTAMERFGRIDTWVNDAGISVYERLQDIPEEDSRGRQQRDEPPHSRHGALFHGSESGRTKGRGNENPADSQEAMKSNIRST